MLFCGVSVFVGGYFVYQEDFSRDTNHGRSGTIRWLQWLSLLSKVHDKAIAIIILSSFFLKKDLCLRELHDLNSTVSN